jgi:glucan biosynthesis protein
VKKAEKLAARDYKEPPVVPDWLVNISYDQWRDIRFKPDQALWKTRSCRSRCSSSTRASSTSTRSR